MNLNRIGIKSYTPLPQENNLEEKTSTQVPPSEETEKNPYENSTSNKVPLPVLNEDELILHILKRMYFGFTPTMLNNAREIRLDVLVEEQINPENLDTIDVDISINRFESIRRTPEELFKREDRG